MITSLNTQLKDNNSEGPSQVIRILFRVPNYPRKTRKNNGKCSRRFVDGDQSFQIG